MERIWVESTLMPDEYREQAIKYPHGYNSKTAPAMFDCEFKWRYGMGERLTVKEIQSINKQIDEFRAYRLKKIAEENVAV